MTTTIEKFEYLSLLHLDPIKEKLSALFRACKNKSILPATNRVFFKKHFTALEIPQLKEYYGNVPFTIWIDRNNLTGVENAQQLGLKRLFSFPLMQITSAEMTYMQKNKSIQIEEITSKQLILNDWCILVSTIYNISNYEFKKFITYVLSTKECNNVKFYIGYYNNQPVATSMLILRKNMIDIHWVGTLAEFRKKGLGKAVTQSPLESLLTSNLNKAILFASDMGKSIYQKIGFKEIGGCHIYCIAD